MNIFTNDDYRRIQAWLKKNAIKDSDFAISLETVPEEDILVITLNMATVPTNYRIKIKDLLSSSLAKIVINSITAKSVKVNNVLTVDAANVKLDNEKGTTLLDVLNYFEDNNKHQSEININLEEKIEAEKTSIIGTNRIADKAVTTAKLSTDIQSLISNLSKTFTFAGIATPTTNPGTPDWPVFYISNGNGTYTNFNNIEITENEVVILKYDTTWHKMLTGIASTNIVDNKITKLDTDITKRYGEIIERSDFVYTIIDSEDKLLFGLKKDGSVYLCSIDDLSKKKFAEVIGLIQDTYIRLSNSISETTNELNKSKVNSVSAERDAEKYVIGVETQGGTTFINNLKTVTSEKVGLMSPTMLQNLLNNTNNLQEIDTHIKIAEIDSESVYPADVTEIVDDYIYAYAITDNNKKLLFGVKKDGSFEWSKGIPNHLKDYIDKANVGNILLERNSSAIQKSDYVLTHGILGINWRKTFVGSDNPLLGINWMLDNLDISYFDTILSISEISQENTMKVLNSCIKMMNENGIPVKITIYSFPTWKEVEGKVSMEDYLRVVDEALSYDGNSDKVLMDGNTYKCKVSAITFTDELEYRVGHTPEELLELLDYLVSYAKGKRNDIIIHAPFSSFYNSLYHEIGSIRLANGHCFSDLFDYYGIDIWTQDIDSNTKNILKAYSIADPINSYDKKMCAVVGFSTLAYTQDEQAINYFKHTLKYLSYGADIFFPFCPEYYMGEYYILEPVLSNASHLYIRLGDNSDMSITDGDGYDDIILRFGAHSWTANATIIMNTVSAKPLKISNNLKNHGIWISGNTGLYVSKVSIVHDNGTEDIIWQGSVDVSSSPLIISKDSFSTITSTDKVVIGTNAKVANGLNDIIPRKAAMCFKYLCKILHKGCTRPTIKIFGDTIIAMWNDDSNRQIYALWSESESNEIPVSIEGNYYITDIYGNVKDINEVSSISEPIIIMNSSKIKIR